MSFAAMRNGIIVQQITSSRDSNGCREQNAVLQETGLGSTSYLARALDGRVMAKWCLAVQRFNFTERCEFHLVFLAYIRNLAEEFLFIVAIYYFRRSQCPRCLRHELSSLSRTLGSWGRIPLKAWMFVQVAALGQADPPSNEYY
jgi:hypothetical protein